MDVLVYVKRKKGERRTERTVEPVSLVIKKCRLRWFGHVERKDDTDWINCCTTMEVEGTEPRRRLRRHDGVISGGYEKIWSVMGGSQSQKIEKEN